VYVSLEGDSKRFTESGLKPELVTLLQTPSEAATQSKSKSSKAKSPKSKHGKTSNPPNPPKAHEKKGSSMTTVSTSSKTNPEKTMRIKHEHLFAGDACPDCRVGIVKQDKFTEGKNKDKAFMGCSQFPVCRFFQWVH
jgi:ssDNA-binding Zn-finger/Zn-ribbon topoisomerase 1